MEPFAIGQLARPGRRRRRDHSLLRTRGLLAGPERRSSGYRQYTPEVVRRVRFIRHAKDLGFALKEIQELLELGVDPVSTCADVREHARAKIADIEGRIAALERMKAALERLARIRALLRRGGHDRSVLLQARDISLDPKAKRVTRAGRPLSLTAREYQLLEFFLRNKNRVLSRDVIYDHVWSSEFSGSLKIVDVYVNYLRAKIDQSFEPKLLKTVRGLGYVLSEESDAP